MKNLKITFVKFYQGVMVNNTSNQTSAKVIEKVSVQEKNLVSIEKSEDGVLITTTEISGRKSYTEIPYNNLAYINYEALETAAPETKAQKTTK